MGGLKETLLNLIKSAMNGFDSTVSSAQDVLTGGLFDTNAVWSSVLALSNALKPFCYVVIGICLLIEIAQVAAKVDIIKWEHGLKLCVKMVFAKLCIDIAPTFLRACYNQASLWISSAMSVGGYTNLGSLMTTEVETQISSISGIWSVIGLLASCLLLSMAVKICGLLIQVIAFGRMFELYLLLAVSPLPCAFFPLGDGSGGGMSRITQKFFKNFIAVCLQGVMIIISIRIFYMIVGTALTSLITSASGGSDPTTVVTDLCYVMLLAGIVLVMAVAKCGSWAKSIMDAM
jgi:membrane protein